MLQGKKSYIVAAATVLYGVLGLVLGHLTPDQAMQLILGGSGLAALRAGIAKR